MKRTALSLAVREGFLEMVKAILKWDPDLDWVSYDEFENNLLHLAATRGHVWICEVLHHKNPMLMEKVNYRGCTPLLAVLDMIGDHVDEIQDDAEIGSSQKDSRWEEKSVIRKFTG